MTSATSRFHFCGDSGEVLREINLPEITINAHPTPFNSAVSITAPEGAAIEIFDVNGRRIDVIPDPDRESRGAAKNLDSRFHGNDKMFVWQPDDNITSGVYLVRATDGGESVSKRIVYLK